MKLIVFLLAFGCLQISWAQETVPAMTPETAPEKTVLEKATETVEETTEKVAVDASGTRFRRMQSSYFAFLNYSPYDLLIPSKMGLTLGIIKDPDKTWELEYLGGSFSVPFVVKDLGGMSDKRYSAIARSYSGSNSFNFSYGLSYFDFSLELGDELMNRLSGGSYPHLKMINIQALGFNLALGNRWSFNKNISFGVDWISWAQPVILTKKDAGFLNQVSDPNDKDNVETAIKVISYTPRLAFLKLQLGILF